MKKHLDKKDRWMVDKWMDLKKDSNGRHKHTHLGEYLFAKTELPTGRSYLRPLACGWAGPPGAHSAVTS